MSLVLYFAPGACSGVTINAIEELGLECEYRKIELASGQHKTPEYLAVNPFGKVPALVCDNQLLTENPAILIYLNSLSESSALIPSTDDPFQRSLFYSDLMWLSSTVHPSVRHVCVPSYYTISEQTDEVVERGKIALNTNLAIAEKRLSESDYWYGENWSICDTYLHWCYTRAQKGGFSLDNYPALLAHQKRVQARPSYQRRVKIEQGE